jgi:hypothetical protein
MKAKKTAAKATTKTASAKAPKAKSNPAIALHVPDLWNSIEVAKAALGGLPTKDLFTLCKHNGVPIHKNKSPTVARLAAHMVVELGVKISVVFEEVK